MRQTGISLYQVPNAANRAEGDIHIYGNPHYWLDPVNGNRLQEILRMDWKELTRQIKILMKKILQDLIRPLMQN